MAHLPLEITLYRDGALYSPAWHVPALMGADRAEAFRVPSLTGNIREEFTLELIWDGSPMTGWAAFRGSLYDGCYSPVAPNRRPGLLYLGPTDCPSVTVFPSFVPGIAVWALCLRVTKPYDSSAAD